MKTIRSIGILIAVLVILPTACQKKHGLARMTVKLTDAPGDFAKVNVDIRGFQIHYSGGANDSWVNLQVNDTIYDLLLLQNNITTLLVDSFDIQAGKITQVRLILGPNNSVETLNGGVYPLKVPSGSESGLKINVNTEVFPDNYVEMLLDFDAAASVVINNDSTFNLKPVIKVLSVNQTPQ